MGLYNVRYGDFVFLWVIVNRCLDTKVCLSELKKEEFFRMNLNDKDSYVYVIDNTMK